MAFRGRLVCTRRRHSRSAGSCRWYHATTWNIGSEEKLHVGDFDRSFRWASLSTFDYILEQHQIFGAQPKINQKYVLEMKLFQLDRTLPPGVTAPAMGQTGCFCRRKIDLMYAIN